MANNLPLAVDIAETASVTPLPPEEIEVAAQDIAARHPEAGATPEEVAEALRDQSGLTDEISEEPSDLLSSGED